MKSMELYQKLVDLWVDEELPQELMDELDAAAKADPQLARDMQSLRQTVQLLRSIGRPTFSESYYPILERMHAIVSRDRDNANRYHQYQFTIAG
jgi:hypothetical protein